MKQITLFVLLCVCLLGCQGRKIIQNNVKEEKGARQSARVVYNLLDIDKNERIEKKEWMDNNNVLTQAEPEHGGSEQDKLQHSMVFDRIDTNNDNLISFDEFLATIPSLKSEQAVHQIHMTLTSDNTEMLFMWVTDDNTTTSEVMVGTQSGHYSNSFTGFTTTYNVGELGGWHKVIHSVKVTGLQLATQYFYKCGDSSAGYSSEFSFTTPPPSSPTVYAMVGDMGTYIPMGWAVAKQIYDDIKQYNISMVAHAGDIAYAGTGGSGEIEEVWDVWASLVEPIASSIPYMLCIGNHEDYYNRTSFMHRFHMPGYENGNTNLWYSIDHGNVHWIFFSTQDDFTPGSPQYQWLEQDLIAANQNRDKVGWIIFVTHRPMYCSDSDEIDQHDVGSPIQVALEPIIVKYGVDIFFCGHMHMYERIHPVVNGSVIQSGNTYNTPKAPMHLVLGTAGAFTDHKYVVPPPDWSASRNGEYGYGKLTVYNNSALQFSFMDEFKKAPTDEFWLLK